MSEALSKVLRGLAHASLGAVVATTLCVWQGSRYITQQEELWVGRGILNEKILSLQGAAPQLLSFLDSGRFEKAKQLQISLMWSDLRFAWTLNREMGGPLDSDLHGIVTNIYPELRLRVDEKELNMLPGPEKHENEVFIREADALIR